jgi:hypothetical protein
MNDAEEAALTEAAAELRAAVPWGRFLKLGQWFMHRPAVNVHWHELVRLLRWYRDEYSIAAERSFTDEEKRAFAAKVLRWAEREQFNGAWSLERGHHVKLSDLADRIESGELALPEDP